MSTISELVEALREWAVDMCISDVPEPELVELLCEAADTIERLSEKCRIDRITLPEWIECNKVIAPPPFNIYEQAWKCSECGYDDGWIEWNYCPNCGIRMQPQEEGVKG